MQLLLCASTTFEIQPSIDFIRTQNLRQVNILITGVGMLATAHSLTKQILQKRPDFVLQAGVGGCLNKNLLLGQTVLVENEMMGNTGVEENGRFKTLFDLNLIQENSKPWKNKKLPNNLESWRTAGLTIADGVTVSEISTNTEKINYYRNQLNASVESMEGAALHYVALQENIPFLQMRSLSNFVGERDKSKWVMDAAIAGLNHELKRILIKLLKE